MYRHKHGCFIKIRPGTHYKSIRLSVLSYSELELIAELLLAVIGKSIARLGRYLITYPSEQERDFMTLPLVMTELLWGVRL